MKNLEEEIELDIAKGEFEESIKKECAWCGIEIAGTLDHYVTYGNACKECSARFSRVMGGIRGTKKNKKGKIVEYKIRDFTEDEIKEMIQDRLDEVAKIKARRNNQ